ncbi:MAG TPA: aspartate dehydrogenase [Methanosarcinales archaeon]|nr:aspartate dehydrogenase [Methanosarcinales archaeon]
MTEDRLRIGVFGCGAIGSAICRAIDEGTIDADLVAICDRSPEIERFRDSLDSHPEAMKISRMAECVDIVVEAASQEAVRMIAPDVLSAGCDLMIMSVGALSDAELLERLKDLARQRGCRIYVPSGAVAGIDGIKSAKVGGIDSVVLTTRKPPAGFAGAPYVREHGIDLSSLRKETLLFEGSAKEAVTAFPANVNVAGTLSLAGIGYEDTVVRVIADPGITRNVHQIEVRGEFGVLTVRTENLPSPVNPKTSYIAVLSAIATLGKLTEPVWVGT